MKKTLCMLLALCLLAGLACTGAASPEAYVALGDSIADGYGLEGYTEPGSAPAGSFPVLVAEELGMALSPLAVSGMDTEGLLQALETEEYRGAVEKASLITLTIGSNDLLKPTIRTIMEHFGIDSVDGFTILRDGGAADAELPDLNTIMTTIGEVNAKLTSEENKAALQACVEQYKLNWEAIIGAIRALNPGAEIIVTNYYNPFKLLDFRFGTVEITVGSAGQFFLDQMNEYLAASPSAKEYTVVDVQDVTTNVKLDMANMAASNMDPHPDAAGHSLIAQRVLEAGGAPASGLGNFISTAVFTEDMYSDLPTAQWARDGVKTATELGIMKGPGDGSFNTKGSLSLAEVLAMAARVRSIYAGDGYVFDQSMGEHWYDVYVLYCVFNGVIESDRFTDYGAPATRAEMAYVFARAVDAEALAALNTVDALPDVAETDACGPEIFTLYRAGVLTGNDEQGTFTPDSAITREQAAAIISRLAVPALRKGAA